MIATNVTAVFRVCRAVVPVMQRQFTTDGRKGTIVNIASDWALVGAHSAVAYGASKGAIAQLTRSMAVDHAADGIRVNAICPGDTETDMLMSGRAGEEHDALMARLRTLYPPWSRGTASGSCGGRGVHRLRRRRLRDWDAAAGRRRQYGVVTVRGRTACP